MNTIIWILPHYKYEIAQWIIDTKRADKVYIPFLPSVHKEKTVDELCEGIEFFQLVDLARPEYIINLDYSQIAPLDKAFLSDALAYEAMFVHLAAHTHVFPVGLYDDSKRLYYCYLRWWHRYISDNEIDYILFDDEPHWMVSYTAYVAARIMGVRTGILTPIGVRVPEVRAYTHVYGDTIDTVGSDIAAYYRTLGDVDADSLSLSGLVGEYFDRSVKRRSEASIRPADRRTWQKYVNKAKYSDVKVHCPRLKILFHNIYYLGSALIKHHSLDRYYSNRYGKRELSGMKRLQLYYRYDALSLREYDKMAVYPDYSEKYIVFPTQIWPEASTVPQAGVYSEQYNAIQLLAYLAAEHGVKIYVKEYYLQPYRDRLFWEELRRHDNVVLIKSDVSSGELMEHALAVGGMTGTCLLEAPFYGIPALVFGGGHCYKDMPGLYEIDTIEQGRAVMKAVVDGVEISLSELKKYFYAIQKNSVFFHRDPQGHVDVDSDDYQLTVNELINLLSDKI